VSIPKSFFFRAEELYQIWLHRNDLTTEDTEYAEFEKREMHNSDADVFDLIATRSTFQTFLIAETITVAGLALILLSLKAIG
jgi:predicted ATPase